VPVAVVVLVREGRVLLGHRHPDRRWYPGCWDLIGGHVEPGETPAEAARRECLEEVGVGVADLCPFALRSSIASLEVFAFRATSWDGAVVNAAPDEHDDLGWFAPDELNGLALADPTMAPDIARALTDAG
jgi:8-oxo-dGTP pyrophosphatase MutT (NUDIX family)